MPAGPLLHIGYHKTASTWLQRGLFASEGFTPLRWRSIYRAFVTPNPFVEAEADLEAVVAACAAATAGRPVLSYERLSGSPHGGGHDSRTIADRLRSAFPDAIVLIVIREQARIIRSTYVQYVAVGGPSSFPRYVAPTRRGQERLPSFRWDHFEYDHLIAHYQGLFGPEAVLVLPYEHLVADPGGFVAAIREHAEVAADTPLPSARSNVSTSALATSIKRRANRVLVRDALNPAGWIDGDVVNGGLQRASDRLATLAPESWRETAERRLTQAVEGAVGSRYAESNARVSALTGLDLASWGYPTG